MLAPMLTLAAVCLTLGFGQSYIIKRVIQPVLGINGETAVGHTNWLLAGISVCIMLFAVLDHCLGFKKTGKGIEAADHFHHAPGLRTIYGWAEKKYFDPYELSRFWVNQYAKLSLKINDKINWCYDVLIPEITGKLILLIKRAHNGSLSFYISWVLGGIVLAVIIFLLSL